MFLPNDAKYVLKAYNLVSHVLPEIIETYMKVCKEHKVTINCVQG